MISTSKSPSPEDSGTNGAPGADWAHTRQRLFLGCCAFSLVCLAAGPVTGELALAHPVPAGAHTLCSLVLLVVLAAFHGRRPSRPLRRSFDVRVCSSLATLQALLVVGVNLI